MSHFEPRIMFFQVKDSKMKLEKLIETARAHFEKSEHLLIVVEDEKAERFVDELLWKSPATSFLPHAIAQEETRELIAITREKKNLNRAKFAFNLCPTPLLIEGPFRLIYDYEDLTSPTKSRLSALRFDAYKQANYPIESS